MSVECLLFMIGVVIQLTTFTVWQQVAVGRFVSGLGVGALSAAVPMVGPSILCLAIWLTRSLVSSRDGPNAATRYTDGNLPAVHYDGYPCRMCVSSIHTSRPTLTTRE